MNEPKNEKRLFFFDNPYIERMEILKSQLKRGDKKRIAQRAGVGESWVSLVFSGKGRSKPVLDTAEMIIRERKN